MEGYIKIEELAMRIDSSTQTINNWYKWKREHPDNELAQMLPCYLQDGKRQTRYWNTADIWKLLEFKQHIVRGRNGIMGDITQRRLNKK